MAGCRCGLGACADVRPASVTTSERQRLCDETARVHASLIASPRGIPAHLATPCAAHNAVSAVACSVACIQTPPPASSS
eukprot:762430-Pyramimonas_sp.AAC.1